VAIGTTSRGIGPCYEDKVGRRGIRMADLVDPESLGPLFRLLGEDKQTMARAFGVAEELDCDAILARYREMAERIRPMVCDTAALLNGAIAAGKSLLFEGAQGTMLDIDHGTYPFVTSSSAAAGGACVGSGVAPTRISGVLGVSKAYITRGGPFPTEQQGEAGELLRRTGNEYGAVTGRPRRCGWFDVPLLRYTATVNGFDSIVITKLDVLDDLAEIPVCVAYRVGGRIMDTMPATWREVEAIEPVYENLPGWKSPTRGISSWASLPGLARDYLKFLESSTGVEVGCVSTGPERNQTMILAGSKMERLLPGAPTSE
jgi:adenylosuccinate synthase